MKRIGILLFAALMVTGYTGVSAKDMNKDLMKANYLYEQYAFHQAIPYYEKLTETMGDGTIFARLADCYYLTKNMPEAEMWYKRAVNTPECSDATKLRYAYTLMTLQKYDEASKYFSEYQNTSPDDKRIANLIESCAKAPSILKQIPAGTARMLPFNTDGSELGPVINGDRLVFTTDSGTVQGACTIDKWTGKPYYSVHSVECSEAGNCLNEMTRLGGKINTKYHDGPVAYSTTGEEMYFTRTNYKREFITNGTVPDDYGVVRLQIMLATGYDSASQTYKKVQPFPYNSKEYSTAHPALSSDGNTLIFVSDMPGGYGGNDIYICKRSDNGSWSVPVNAGNIINTEGDEMFPFIAEGGTLYFSSNGHVGLGGLDVYMSSWDNTSNTFRRPENVGVPVNSSYDDMSLATYKNGEYGYFSSNRPALKKGDNIYHINMKHVYLALQVRDAATGEHIPAGNVSIKSGDDSRVFTANSRGMIFTRLVPDAQYVLQVSKPGYKPASINLATNNRSHNDTIVQEVLLESDFAIHYNALVLDENTYMPIENPMVVFAKLGGSGADTMYLNSGEEFSINLNPDAEYSVYAVKNKYYSSEHFISTFGIHSSSGTTRLLDTLFMKELRIGEVYKIDNIYYDYDKATIREDARPALNSLIQLLQQYPDMTIQINSHTDCRGSAQYNQKLSGARANSVIKYLKERGITAKRLKYKGFGESSPKEECTNCEQCTEVQHQRNRRTEFQILSM